MIVLKYFVQSISCNKNSIKLLYISKRTLQTSSTQLTRKQERTPYPWKNHDYQNTKFQYVSKILDSDLTDENKEALLEERLQISNMMHQNRQQILRETPWVRNEYIPHKTNRCGLIGYKIGIMPHWLNTGKRITTTMYQIMDNVALNYIPPNEVENLFRTQRYYMRFKDDYPRWVPQKRWGLQFVGAISADPAEFTAEYSGLFTKFGVNPRRKLARFLVSEDAAIEPGRELSVQHFRIGDYIDVTARSTNFGFQGVMVKDECRGGPAAHGSTKFHRRIGSIGHGVNVLRGQTMPGVMGNRLRTIRGLQVVRMDYKYSILYINGVTPGPIHSYAHLCDTWFKYRIDERVRPPAMPTLYETDEEWIDWTERPEDDFVDCMHKFDDPSIIYAAEAAK